MAPHERDLAGRVLHLSDITGRSLDRATVFVIDHDAAVRDALSVTLRSSGFAVRTFGSAGDFLGTLPIRQRGCLLVEFDLVDMAGTDLIARLSARRETLPAILMSARLRMPDVSNLEPTRLGGFLQKPFGRDELVGCLQQIVGRP